MNKKTERKVYQIIDRRYNVMIPGQSFNNRRQAERVASKIKGDIYIKVVNQ